MKNLLDHIIDELLEDHIYICEDASFDSYHCVHIHADREKIKVSLARAFQKSMEDTQWR